MKCIVCGKEFKSERLDQKYCDVRCRIKNNKQRVMNMPQEEYQRGINKAIEVLKEYYDEVHDDFNRDFGYSALNDLVTRLEKLKG